MTSVNFCYWLQGFFELQGAKKVTPAQVEIMKAHLNMVFVHEIDPAMGDQAHQDELNAIHTPTKPDFNTPDRPWNRPAGPGGEIYRC